MKMKGELPAGVTGLVAEMAGQQPLSEDTKGRLKVPKAVKAYRRQQRKLNENLKGKGKRKRRQQALHESVIQADRG